MPACRPTIYTRTKTQADESLTTGERKEIGTIFI